MPSKPPRSGLFRCGCSLPPIVRAKTCGLVVNSQPHSLVSLGISDDPKRSFQPFASGLELFKFCDDFHAALLLIHHTTTVATPLVATGTLAAIAMQIASYS